MPQSNTSRKNARLLPALASLLATFLILIGTQSVFAQTAPAACAPAE